MKLLHKRKLGIYPVTFIFTSDKELFKESSGEDIRDMSDGCVFTDDGKTSNVWMYIEQNDTGSINVQTLVHECFHASIFTAEMMGIELDYHNDEPLAYLADWFAGAVLDFNHIDNGGFEDVPPNGNGIATAEHKENKEVKKANQTFKDGLLDNQETIIKIVKQALAREGITL